MAASDCIPEIRDIPGFPGYGVSADGRVWSRQERRGKRGGGCEWFFGQTWHEIRGCKEGDGYLLVNLKKGGRGHSFKVHTLVLLAFVGPRPEGMECRHLNGNRADNRLANLSWGTHRENEEDKVLHGSVLRGEQVGNSVLSAREVRLIRGRAAAGEKHADIARDFGIRPVTVADVAHRRRWGHVR